MDRYDHFLRCIAVSSGTITIHLPRAKIEKYHRAVGNLRV